MYLLRPVKINTHVPQQGCNTAIMFANVDDKKTCATHCGTATQRAIFCQFLPKYKGIPCRNVRGCYLLISTMSQLVTNLFSLQLLKVWLCWHYHAVFMVHLCHSGSLCRAFFSKTCEHHVCGCHGDSAMEHVPWSVPAFKGYAKLKYLGRCRYRA